MEFSVTKHADICLGHLLTLVVGEKLPCLVEDPLGRGDVKGGVPLLDVAGAKAAGSVGEWIPRWEERVVTV